MELKDQILNVNSALARLTELDSYESTDFREDVDPVYSNLQFLDPARDVLKKLLVELQIIAKAKQINDIQASVEQSKEKILALNVEIEGLKDEYGV